MNRYVKAFYAAALHQPSPTPALQEAITLWEKYVASRRRGTCPRCGGVYAVNSDGTLFSHPGYGNEYHGGVLPKAGTVQARGDR